MSRPTGKLLFAYQTIANMEAKIIEQANRIKELEANQESYVIQAWAGTDEDGKVECLGMNQSNRFDTPLYTKQAGDL